MRLGTYQHLQRRQLVSCTSDGRHPQRRLCLIMVCPRAALWRFWRKSYVLERFGTYGRAKLWQSDRRYQNGRERPSSHRRRWRLHVFLGPTYRQNRLQMLNFRQWKALGLFCQREFGSKQPASDRRLGLSCQNMGSSQFISSTSQILRSWGQNHECWMVDSQQQHFCKRIHWQKS